MASSKILTAIRTKTKDALKNFVPIAGKSVMKIVAEIGAKEAGVTEVFNGKFNGEHGAAYFTIKTSTNNEVHWWVKKSAILEYVIIRTNPSNVQERATYETVYAEQMPQKPSGGWNDGSGASSSN